MSALQNRGVCTLFRGNKTTYTEKTVRFCSMGYLWESIESLQKPMRYPKESSMFVSHLEKKTAGAPQGSRPNGGPKQDFPVGNLHPSEGNPRLLISTKTQYNKGIILHLI